MMTLGFAQPKVVICLLALILTAPQGVEAMQIAIQVNDPRAVAQAALILEKQVSIPINYEDAPYLFRDDVVDVAPVVMSAAQRAAHPDAKINVPRGGKLSLQLNVPDKPDAAAILGSLNLIIAEARFQGYPGVYAAQAVGGGFAIIPTAGRNATGTQVPVNAVLDAKVTLPLGERTAGDALESILQQVQAATGTRILLATGPTGALVMSRVAIAAAGESARDVLIRLLMALGNRGGASGWAPFSYHLYFDPGQRNYYLNIHRVESSPMSLPQSSPVPSSPGNAGPYGRKTVAPEKQN